MRNTISLFITVIVIKPFSCDCVGTHGGALSPCFAVPRCAMIYAAPLGSGPTREPECVYM